MAYLAGVIRFKHLKRTVVLRVSETMVRCHCSKGKQRALIEGFDFALPRHFATVKFDWWPQFLTLYATSSPAARQRLGLIFDTVKERPLTNAACVEASRRVLAEL